MGRCPRRTASSATKWSVYMGRYQELLDKNANGFLSPDERDELVKLGTEFDRFMLRKAHAVALLRWRGHRVPLAEAV